MMHTPNAAELLRAWETAAPQPPYMRGATLLAAAIPDAGDAEVRAWGIGKRDHHLLALRELLFGPDMPCVVDCAACGSVLEMVLQAAGLQTDYLDAEREVRVADVNVVLRSPSTADLMAVAQTRSAAGLAARCIVRADGDVPPDAVCRALADIDPQADLQLDLQCAECQHTWSTPFDIAAFLWREVDAWAAKTLREVHLLARAHGWTEGDILALTPWRRQRYLDLVLQ